MASNNIELKQRDIPIRKRERKMKAAEWHKKEKKHSYLCPHLTFLHKNICFSCPLWKKIWYNTQTQEEEEEEGRLKFKPCFFGQKHCFPFLPCFLGIPIIGSIISLVLILRILSFSFWPFCCRALFFLWVVWFFYFHHDCGGWKG